jgi:hypothetical protein
MGSLNETRPMFSKGALVAARLAGSNWDFDDVAIVLDVRSEGGDFWTTFITERGEVVSMTEVHARAVFDHLQQRDESIFVLTYEMLSKWQVEEDHESGYFSAGFERARALLAGRRLVRRMAVTKSVVGG